MKRLIAIMALVCAQCLPFDPETDSANDALVIYALVTAVEKDRK